MSRSISERNATDCFKALALLEEALQVLDDADAPANVGAYLDMAICQLRDALEVRPTGGEATKPERG